MIAVIELYLVSVRLRNLTVSTIEAMQYNYIHPTPSGSVPSETLKLNQILRIKDQSTT